MNSSAVFMMILSIVLLWGGLLAAIIHLTRHPDE
ncbi:methionine/alanine import family NSS transporter small subunit [Alkanindiges illinoisensis]|nr:methionine/alanine import family NSS transporter small subunit [Alkanindiges illinoisensis]